MGGTGFAVVLFVYGLGSAVTVFVAGTLCLLMGVYVHYYAKETAPLRPLVSGCAIGLGVLMMLVICALFFWFFRSTVI